MQTKWLERNAVATTTGGSKAILLCARVCLCGLDQVDLLYGAWQVTDGGMYRVAQKVHHSQ